VRRAACLAAVAVLLLAACGGDDGGGGGNGGGGDGDVFPAGGSVPEQRVADLNQAAAAAGCELNDTKSLGEQDRLHTNSQEERVRYRSNPPTLGKHAPLPAEDGLYQQAPSDESLVHSQEHGRVVIWAKPSLPRDVRAALRALFEEDDYQLLLVPRANMPYAVAATAWNRDPTPGGTGRTLGCPEWNEKVVDALRAFRDDNRSQGPEPVP
jgi:hypothetical protein